MLTTVLLTLILTAAPTAADRQFREVAVYDGHVTLDVPTGWNEIPPEVLEFYSLRAAESSGGRMTEIYQHGFRPHDPEIDFALPQVLIQIRESGRLNYRQFLHLPTAEQLQAAGEESLADHAGPMVLGMELGDAAFDRTTFSLHLSNILDLRIEGETSVESVAFLTERGLFTLHLYAHATDLNSTERLFTRITQSVRFDGELRYRPRLTDHWPPSLASILIAAAILIAAVAGTVHLVQRRHRTP